MVTSEIRTKFNYVDCRRLFPCLYVNHVTCRATSGVFFRKSFHRRSDICVWILRYILQNEGHLWIHKRYFSWFPLDNSAFQNLVCFLRKSYSLVKPTRSRVRLELSNQFYFKCRFVSTEGNPEEARGDINGVINVNPIISFKFWKVGFFSYMM